MLQRGGSDHAAGHGHCQDCCPEGSSASTRPQRSRCGHVVTNRDHTDAESPSTRPQRSHCGHRVRSKNCEEWSVGFNEAAAISPRSPNVGDNPAGWLYTVQRSRGLSPWSLRPHSAHQGPLRCFNETTAITLRARRHVVICAPVMLCFNEAAAATPQTHGRSITAACRSSRQRRRDHRGHPDSYSTSPASSWLQRNRRDNTADTHRVPQFRNKRSKCFNEATAITLRRRTLACGCATRRRHFNEAAAVTPQTLESKRDFHQPRFDFNGGGDAADTVGDVVPVRRGPITSTKLRRAADTGIRTSRTNHRLYASTKLRR